MVKITLGVDGMMCGMCEAHVNDAVRKDFAVKKVSSSHKKGVTEIISEEEIAQDKLEKCIENTGYKVVSYSVGPYKKKGFFGSRK